MTAAPPTATAAAPMTFPVLLDSALFSFSIVILSESVSESKQSETFTLPFPKLVPFLGFFGDL